MGIAAGEGPLTVRDPASLWRELATRTRGENYAEEYAQAFDAAEAEGSHVHGEADFVTRLAPAGARILDAGCGTGRIAGELARRGFEVHGVDADPAMIAVARERHPKLRFDVEDLADFSGGKYDLIVAAGNILPFIHPEARLRALICLRQALSPGGRLVLGFGITEHALPEGLDPYPADLFTQDAEAAGLHVTQRFSTWGGDDFAPGSDYLVAVLR